MNNYGDTHEGRPDGLPEKWEIMEIDKRITVKGRWVICPFCLRKYERGIDSLAGDLVECFCGKLLEIEGVE